VPGLNRPAIIVVMDMYVSSPVRIRVMVTLVIDMTAARTGTTT
jgi:hypothetical protein